MNYSNDSSSWNKNYSKKKFYLKWPDELVVRFHKKFMKKKSGLRLLDLGCGSGRHCELFATENYDVYGCDISSKSISITKKRLKKFNLKDNFVKSFSYDLPYKSDFFHYVIVWHSIYYNTYENMIKSIKEISRVLIKDGIAFITIITSGDSRIIKDGINSEKTFRITKKNNDHSGLTLSYLTKSEAKKIFKKYFELVSIGYQEFYFEDTSKTSHLLIIVRKK